MCQNYILIDVENNYIHKSIAITLNNEQQGRQNPLCIRTLVGLTPLIACWILNSLIASNLQGIWSGILCALLIRAANDPSVFINRRLNMVSRCECRCNNQKGWAALRTYADQPTRPWWPLPRILRDCENRWIVASSTFNVSSDSGTRKWPAGQSSSRVHLT